MSLAFDTQRSVHEQQCGRCHGPYRLVSGRLTWSGAPHAVYFAGCHQHGGAREVLIDVILDWASGTDRVTIGCRVGPEPGRAGPIVTLVSGAAGFGDDPQWGRKLSADEALADHRLPEFWAAVDYVLIHDPTVRPHVYDID